MRKQDPLKNLFTEIPMDNLFTSGGTTSGRQEKPTNRNRWLSVKKAREYLEVSPEELRELREAGVVECKIAEGYGEERILYSTRSMDLILEKRNIAKVIDRLEKRKKRLEAERGYTGDPCEEEKILDERIIRLSVLLNQ